MSLELLLKFPAPMTEVCTHSWGEFPVYHIVDLRKLEPVIPTPLHLVHFVYEVGMRYPLLGTFNYLV